MFSTIRKIINETKKNASIYVLIEYLHYCQTTEMDKVKHVLVSSRYMDTLLEGKTFNSINSLYAYVSTLGQCDYHY